MVSIEQAQHEVQAATDRILRLAGQARVVQFESFETKLWEQVLCLGRAAVTLFLSVQSSHPLAAEYSKGDRRYRLRGTKTDKLGTRFGKVDFERPIARPVDDPRGAADRPIDRRLGLCSGFSLTVVTDIARLCATLSFSNSRSLYREWFHWAPASRAVSRMVDALGTKAREFLEWSPAPDDDGEFLVVEVDARGAPMISPREHQKRRRPKRKTVSGTKRNYRRMRRKLTRRPRRGKGQKSKNSKAAFVGVVYTLRRTPDGLEGPINKRLIATFESHEALFVWLDREVKKRGYGTKRMLFLADGSEHIWRLQERFFPDAEVCLDWYHAVEYLWKAGRCLQPEGSDELSEWVTKQADRLYTGAIKAMMAELRSELHRLSKAKDKDSRDKHDRLKGYRDYFKKNLSRLRYREMLREDFDIGSGAVEGAVRNLIAIRLDGPGMRWGRGRSEQVLYLRCVLLNNQWSEFIRWLKRQPQIVLAAQPEPALPYAAEAA